MPPDRSIRRRARAQRQRRCGRFLLRGEREECGKKKEAAAQARCTGGGERRWMPSDGGEPRERTTVGKSSSVGCVWGGKGEEREKRGEKEHSGIGTHLSVHSTENMMPQETRTQMQARRARKRSRGRKAQERTEERTARAAQKSEVQNEANGMPKDIGVQTKVRMVNTC
jgi:hypothetical protein